jgi:flavodoxin
MRSLVVFYSRTGTSKFVAEKVVSELSAETEEAF